MVYSARVTEKILNTHHCCRLPLVQVGLEIPVQVIVKMDYSPQNEDVIFKYESLVDADRQMRLKSINQLQKQSQNTRLNMISSAVLG